MFNMRGLDRFRLRGFRTGMQITWDIGVLLGLFLLRDPWLFVVIEHNGLVIILLGRSLLELYPLIIGHPIVSICEFGLPVYCWVVFFLLGLIFSLLPFITLFGQRALLRNGLVFCCFVLFYWVVVIGREGILFVLGIRMDYPLGLKFWGFWLGFIISCGRFILPDNVLILN